MVEGTPNASIDMAETLGMSLSKALDLSSFAPVMGSLDLREWSSDNCTSPEIWAILLPLTAPITCLGIVACSHLAR